MSSRPTTPTKDPHITQRPQESSVSVSTTQPLTDQGAATGLRGEMLATAHYPAHAPYSYPTHHAAFSTHHGGSAVANLSGSTYAPSMLSLEPSNIGSAAQPATLASSSEDTQHQEPVPDKGEPGILRRSSSRLQRPTTASTEQAAGQSSTEAGPVEEKAAAPPRKKRTRTLTTAHQSSVLLALLAKTPFPTTAERESVGRQIGLTARKVQVWFQNQRQKQKKAAHAGTITTGDQGATTSAPLPLSRQPGFSALHAARMGVADPSNAPSYTANVPPHTPAGQQPTTYGHSATASVSPIHRESLSAPCPSAYPHSYTEHGPYYQLPSRRAAINDSFPSAAAQPSSPPRPRTSHSHLAPASFSSPPYPEAFHHGQAASISMGGSSYGHASHHSTSQATSTSDDHSLPPPSETGVHYAASPTDAWRYKPLPPLPPSRSPRDRPLNWEHQSAQHEFRPPPVLPVPSRTFSNPDMASNEPDAGGHFTHIRGSSTALPPPSSYVSAHYGTQPSVLPAELSAPSSYHGHSEYRAGEINPSTATPMAESHYPVRYGEPHPSPGGASTTSSPSYAEGVPLGVAPLQHGTGRVAYSPIADRRRNRPSYDSSLTRSQLGKRSWSSEDERSTKRARTDDDHTSVPMGPSALGVPAPHAPAVYLPSSYPLPPVNPSMPINPTTLGIQMATPQDVPRQPDNPQRQYFSPSDQA